MATAKRELFKAPEVCEMAQLQPYVLRTWEAEFPSLGQTSGNGPRVYRRADVDKVLQIKQLVFVEGLTLAGARRRLEEAEETHEPSVAAFAVDSVLDNMAKKRLRAVRSGLEAILELLDRGAGGGGRHELQLVPPPGRRATKSPKTPAPKRRKVS